MNSVKEKTKVPNPEEQSNRLSKLFFTHTRHILTKGNRKELTNDDLYQVRPSYESGKLGDKLEKQWNKQIKENKTSIILLFWNCFGRQYLRIIFSLIFLLIVTLSQPKLIETFISHFSSEDDSKTNALLYGTLIVLMEFSRVLYLHNFKMNVKKLAFKFRAGIVSLIYRKILKMRSFEFDEISVGNTVTLITRDINDYDNCLLALLLTTQDFFNFLILCCLMYFEIGWLFTILVLVFIFVILLNSVPGFWVKTLKLKSLEKTDKRYQTIKEVLSAIQVVKLNSWYDFYEKEISKFRKKEVYFISKMYTVLFSALIVSEGVSTVSWYLLVISSIYFGLKLNASTLFFLMSCVNILSTGLRLDIPLTAHNIAKIITVSKRIENFLLRPSKKKSEDQTENFSSATIAALNLEIITPNCQLLHSSSFEINKGIYVVTGSTGSGKSLFLKVLAKEYDNIGGNIHINGNVSYASQEPWLFSSTIKQNILFGSNVDLKRYSRVLEVCGLVDDLQQLKDGDETIVSNGGSNLSKGQQCRINLARAIYKNSDIYLLDDCLSNLDVLVSDLVFENCFVKFLEGKTVVLVSRNPRYISRSNGVFILEGNTLKIHNDEGVGKKVPDDLVTLVWKKSEGENLSNGFDETDPLLRKEERNGYIYDESKVRGQVSLDVYRKYIKDSGGVIMLLFSLVLTGMVQFLQRSINKKETNWINVEQIIFDNSTEKEYSKAIIERKEMFYLIPALVATMTVLSLLKVKLFWTLVGKASLTIHKLLFNRVINSSMQFFDKYLIGNILNRFSEDIFFTDELVPFLILHVLKYIVEMIGTIVLIATTNTTFLIICLIFAGLVTYARIFYLKTGRALKRLEFAVRSPLISQIANTIAGLPTVRILKAESILREEFDRHQDLYTSASYTNASCETSFLMIVDGISLLLLIISIILFVFPFHEYSIGNIGLVLTQIVRFVDSQFYLYMFWTELETQMTSVERVLEYTKQEQEVREGVVIEDWPSEGEIKFENVNLSYKREEEDILKNLNFVIKSKEKVAIVGRTASGKTSVISALLRLYPVEGKIYVDNTDVTTLPLDFFRSKISVFTSDPVLFSGSLRQNIDPMRQYADEEIWRALKTVRLKFFESLEIKLNIGDLSLGQKQLICLCRILIRNTKIVVMDEVTANIDYETRCVIQNIIFEKFFDSTVLAITHDLKHALCFDKIMVLEDGRIREFDAPSCLLKDQNGIFYKMYKRL